MLQNIALYPFTYLEWEDDRQEKKKLMSPYPFPGTERFAPQWDLFQKTGKVQLWFREIFFFPSIQNNFYFYVHINFVLLYKASSLLSF
jgi:hypothetical protein